MKLHFVRVCKISHDPYYESLAGFMIVPLN